MRKPRRAAIAVVVAELLAVAVVNGVIAAPAVTRGVDAIGNLWAAGQTGAISDGALPAEIVVPAGATVVRFPHVSGSWSNTGPMVPPDGERPVVDPPFACGAPPPCIIAASNGLSGLIDAARFWYLTGVFIGPGVPGGTPPPSIDFTQRHEFKVFMPAVGQVFFIGDGQTSEGVIQRFRVPAGATRLVLGMADICAPGDAAGCFYDNRGSLQVTTAWDNMPDTATLPAPAAPGHDGSWLLLVAVSGVMVLVGFRSRHRPR